MNRTILNTERSIEQNRDALRAWLQEGAQGCLIFERGAAGSPPISFYRLLYEGPRRWVLKNRLRSAAAYIAELSPLPGWKNFWYRQAGVKIGANTCISHGVRLDLMFPQLLTLEENCVLGMEAVIQSHYSNGTEAYLGQVIIKSDSMIGGRSVIIGPAVIGPRAVVALAAVLIKQDVAEATLVGGIPARPLKSDF
jgi:serine acetyltransferase